MSSTFDLQMVLTRLVGSAPFLAVAFAGIVLCLARESRPVRVRIAVGCALALQLLSHLVLPFLYTHVAQLMNAQFSGSDGRAGMIAISLVATSVSATALGLLLFAAFSRDDLPPTGDR
ncbi:MAG: hypothetical protein JNG89_21010 [Planctomycetaceae bacterium]|nr:hypothetical protein [Planctomycetaceae bacterium]